jgi:hypothetical protein
MFRLSRSVRRFAIAASLAPAIAFTARGAQAPSDTQAPAGGAAAQVIVPFEHNARQNAILVRATVNQRPAVLLLDTGARTSVISREIAGMANEDLRGGFSSGGPGFKGEALTMRATVRLGGETWHDHPVAVMNLARFSACSTDRSMACSAKISCAPSDRRRSTTRPSGSSLRGARPMP